MYKEIKFDDIELQGVRRLSDGAFIPLDPGNRDYQEYLEWLAQGNEPESADEATE
jgi:hypothetical protein